MKSLKSLVSKITEKVSEEKLINAVEELISKKFKDKDIIKKLKKELKVSADEITLAIKLFK